MSTYIIGKPRTGKSTLLEHLILKDINDGCGVCVIDPHSDLINSLLSHVPPARADNVILLDLLSPDVAFGINPFSCENANDPIAVERTLTRVMQIFERLWGFGTQNSSWGPRLEQYLRSVTLVLLEHGLTMAEAPLLLSLQDGAFRQHLIKTLSNPQMRAFWEEFEGLTKREKEMRIESTSNKLAAFIDTPLGRHIVGQEHDTVDWRHAMDEGKIVLVKLDAQLADLSGLIGSVIVGRILEAGLSRENDPVRRPFHLYCDEFQRFATDDFARLLTETGKWGIQTTVAHQYRGQLDGRNRGATLQAGSLVVFAVSGEDAKELAGNFKATPPDPLVPIERPVRVPCGNPVYRLLSSGHQNPVVRELAETVLRPMASDFKWMQREDRYSENDSWGRGSPPITVQKTLSGPWSEWLLEASQTSSNPYHSVYAYLCRRSAFSVSIAVIDEVMTMLNDLLVSALRKSVSETNFALELQRIIWSLHDYLQLWNWFSEDDPIMGKYVIGTLFATSFPGDPRTPNALLAYQQAYRARCVKEFGHGGFVSVETRAAYSVEGYAGREGTYYPAERTVTQDFSPAECVALCEPFLDATLESALRFWHEMWQLADALADDPILVDSGQYETVLEPSRTYSDVTDQIANELVMLPRFSAKVRQNGEEWLASYAPVEAPRHSNGFTPSGTNRLVVEAAIAERHRGLRDDAHPLPPAPKPSRTSMPDALHETVPSRVLTRKRVDS